MSTETATNNSTSTTSANAAGSAAPAPNKYQSSSLYVGDLHPDTTEAQLIEKFASVGNVVLVRICRDKITRQSLGYAYVNYSQPSEAERALDTLNFESINGKPMRIMWSQRDPSLRKSGLGNVFIKNLDSNIDNKDLYDTFSEFGDIISCKIITDEQNNSKGYGFVHFETREAADKAIANVNNMLMNGKKVYVGQFLSKTERSSAQDQRLNQIYTNVFVKNFDDLLDEQKLAELFGKYGEITSIKLGKTPGFGFVNFKRAEDAQQAVKELNDYELSNGKKLFAGRHQKKNERAGYLMAKAEERRNEKLKKYQGINLYVKNLDDKIDDERLKKEFSAFGQITSAKVMSEQGRSKGFGFVCYTTPEEATRAVTEMNGRIVGSKPLYVAIAQRKDDRKKILSAQFRERLYNSQQLFQQPYYGGGGVAQGGAGLQAGPGMQPGGMYGYQNAAAAYQTAAGAPMAALALAGSQSRFMPSQMMPNAVMNYQYGAVGGAGAAMGAAGPASGPRSAVPRWPMQMVNSNYYQQQQFNQNMRAQMQQQQQMGFNSVNNRVVNPGVANANRAMNMNQMQMQQQQQQQQQLNRQKSASNGQEPLTSAMLAKAPLQQQKQMIGERLYPLIQAMHPEWASKITGMLLEIDNSELLHMLDSADSLKAKVDEAVQVLKVHQEKIEAQ